MKRSWTTILLVTGLIVLIVLLGGLQYRWMTKIADSESEKAHKQVQETTERFAADFNREIQNAYFNFQTESGSWKNRDWAPFNERYEFWHSKANYPELITDFYYFDAKGDAAPLRYDVSQRAFEPVEVTPELASLRSRFGEERNFRPVLDDIYTLVLPVRDTSRKVEQLIIKRAPGVELPKLGMPETTGYLAIRLDEGIIKGQIIPDLTAKYFSDGDYRVGVNGKGGKAIFAAVTPDAADANAKLFDLSPDNVIFYSNKDLMSSITPRHEGTVMLNSRVESHTFSSVDTGEKGAKTYKIEVRGDGKPRTQVFTSTSDTGSESPWILSVQHSSGSLDGYLASTLRRNLAIGFGLLFLLAAAVLAIILSAQRAKKVAQRQIDFVSSVSHEFRTPLAVIYSAGENLADGVAKENGQVSRYGELIKGEGRKLSGMVEQILDFEGARSGRKKYSFGDASVDEIVNDAIAECRPLIDDKHISLETAVAAALPRINADKKALSQAIQNLIVNSVKYGNGSAWLRVSADNGGGTVEISVEDRGIGISKTDLRQIFEPFFRSREVVDAQIHGNGLGLSLVKQTVEAHGGSVSAQSEVGKGSKFTIELRSAPPA